MTKKDVIGNEVKNLKCSGNNDVRFFATLEMTDNTAIIVVGLVLCVYLWKKNI